MGPPPARHCPAQPPSRIGFARQSVTVCHCHFVTCHYYSFSPKTTAEQKTLVRRVVRDFTRVRNTTRPIIIIIIIIILIVIEQRGRKGAVCPFAVTVHYYHYNHKQNGTTIDKRVTAAA